MTTEINLCKKCRQMTNHGCLKCQAKKVEELKEKLAPATNLKFLSDDGKITWTKKKFNKIFEEVFKNE